MPSVNTSQACFGFSLIHGTCSTTSFLIPWFEDYCYDSSNTELHRTSLWDMWMEPSRTEEAGPTRTWAGQGWAQGERVSDKLQLRRQGALGCRDLVGQGPPRSWRSWERVQSWPGVAGRWHWGWWDPGAPCDTRFFTCFWELTSFERVGILWSSEMARGQANQKGKGKRNKKNVEECMVEEVNTVSTC